MEYEINTGVSKTSLSVKLTGITKFDEFRYRMVRENTISGIVSPVRGQENDLTVYTYDITGMQSIKNQFEGKKFHLNEIKKLYVDIISILEKSEEYFLDKNCFLLSEEFIFYDENSKSYKLMYCPESVGEMKLKFADFTEYVVNQTEYSDKAAVALIYDVFQMMRDEHTTIHEVLTYITEGHKQGNVNARGMEQNKVIPMRDVPVAEPFVPKVAPVSVQSAAVKQPSLAKNPFESEIENKKNGFSTKKLLLCTAIVIAGASSFLALYMSGFLFISHTKKLDMSKFAGIALLIGVVVSYVCYKIFDKKVEEKETKKEQIKSQKNLKEEKPLAVVSPAPIQPVASVQPVYQAQQATPVQPIYPAQSVAPVQPITPAQPVRQQPVMEVQRTKLYRLIAGQEKNAQQFVLNKSPYVLGKSYEQVDGVVYSDAVSKVHAEFIEERGTLYVIDMSSTNGTYVNRRKIASNEKVPVEDGDRIQIADKEYLLCS